MACIGIDYADKNLVIGLVYARALVLGPSPEGLLGEIGGWISANIGTEPSPAEAVDRDAVRNLLRASGYKPSGRGKPASEYLLQAAREGRFPSINNAVDCNNLVSLESRFPVSILDARAFSTIPAASVSGLSLPELIALPLFFRAGTRDENYIFNAAGQSIDLEGLLSVCAVRNGKTIPLGNAVKDSMEGKLKWGPDSGAQYATDAIGVIYGTKASSTGADMDKWTQRFSRLLETYCRAECAVAVFP